MLNNMKKAKALTYLSQVECIRLYLIRHGQSKTNLDKDIIASGFDYGLTDIGQTQIKTTAQKLANLNIAFDLLYTSKLLRAKESALIVAKELGIDPKNIIEDCLLNELSPGEWNGQPKILNHTLENLSKIRNYGKFFSTLEGESAFEVQIRAYKYLNKILSKLNHKSKANVVIVSHALYIKLFLQLIFGFEFSKIDNQKVNHGEIIRIDLTQEGFQLIFPDLSF